MASPFRDRVVPAWGTKVHLQLRDPGPNGWPTNEAIIYLQVHMASLKG
jgi:hypothetical protein